MCELCEKFGEDGGRWYLNPANYARMLYRVARPDPLLQRGGGSMAGTASEQVEARMTDPEKYSKMLAETNRKLQEEHYDQVITLQEAQAIVEIAFPVGVVHCVCRRGMVGLPDDENFGCIGLGPGVYKWERWPDSYHGGVAFVSPEEAKAALAKMNQKGFVQKVNAVHLGNYICELCSCSYPACADLRNVLDYGQKHTRKGHYVFNVEPDKCDDCGRCYSRCQFYSLSRDPARRKANINMFKCYGCGLCKEVCNRDAIAQLERAKVPAVANNWWA